MKISIIIPVYNVAQYLDKALDSVVNQTYKDIEIICVNDGSTDNSLQIIENYAKKDKRIKVINQDNSGLYVVRQNGVKVATGDYITYVDGDDWLDADACDKIVSVAENSNADIIQYGVIMESLSPKDPIVKALERLFAVDVESINNSDEMLKRCYIDRAIPWNIATKAIKTSVAKEVVTHQEPLRINQLEDFLSCFYLFMLSNRWVHLDSKLYHYRYGTGISTKRTITSKEFERNLEYYNGIKSLHNFASSRDISSIAHDIAFKVIPQYAVEDSMHFVMRMEDKSNYCHWSDLWANAAGSDVALHALAGSMLSVYERLEDFEERFRKKKRKYRMLLWITGSIAVVLLIVLICGIL